MRVREGCVFGELESFLPGQQRENFIPRKEEVGGLIPLAPPTSNPVKSVFCHMNVRQFLRNSSLMLRLS